MDDLALDIFSRAVKLEGGARAAFLDQVCAGDAALGTRVGGMIREFEKGNGAGPDTADILPANAATIAGLREQIGTMIGPFKILQEIGEGGFGFVYMAQQTAPIKRKVALKIVKPGMDTRQVIGRFEAERQALAMMDHPNIAKVLDAGATPTGRPYFVMELVRGVPITEYCDTASLTTRERLDLFTHVCQAVLHAHQKGIIHRDIKPSNVMVTLHDGVPVPKVIDFGIAKATGQDLTDKTVFTEYRHFIGTPEYMSPEQAAMSGLDVDTRADIYSLGVLLYELLTGSTPLDATKLRSRGRRRDPEDHQGAGAGEAQHARGPDPRQEELDRERPGLADRGRGGQAPAHRPRSPAQGALGRPGLDRHEGDRKGPLAPLRDVRRARRGHPALPGE